MAPSVVQEAYVSCPHLYQQFTVMYITVQGNWPREGTSQKQNLDIYYSEFQLTLDEDVHQAGCIKLTTRCIWSVPSISISTKTNQMQTFFFTSGTHLPKILWIPIITDCSVFNRVNQAIKSTTKMFKVWQTQFTKEDQHVGHISILSKTFWVFEWLHFHST